MEYYISQEIKEKALDVISCLGLNHIFEDRFICILSKGSKSKAIARCHGLSKVMQMALNVKAVYVLEFIEERFKKLSEKDKTKVIIHELLHIPMNLGGGFRYHDFVNNRKVDLLYANYVQKKIGEIETSQNEKSDLF
jgi:predicted metallopeptidase